MKERNENITEELTQEVEKLMQFVKILQVVKNKILGLKEDIISQ